jgi:hypothetical protein
MIRGRQTANPKYSATHPYNFLGARIPVRDGEIHASESRGQIASLVRLITVLPGPSDHLREIRHRKAEAVVRRGARHFRTNWVVPVVGTVLVVS